MKNKIKTIAINEGKFQREDEEVTLTATVTRGPFYIESIHTDKLQVDGTDSTEKITKIVNQVKAETNLILTHGTMLAGLNTLDINKLHRDTGKPIITVLKDKPNLENVKEALRKTENFEEKIEILEKNPEYREHSHMYYTSTGIEEKKAKQAINQLTPTGEYPQPLRISRLISRAIRETV